MTGRPPPRRGLRRNGSGNTLRFGRFRVAGSAGSSVPDAAYERLRRHPDRGSALDSGRTVDADTGRHAALPSRPASPRTGVEGCDLRGRQRWPPRAGSRTSIRGLRVGGGTSPTERVSDLVDALTREEKLQLVHGAVDPEAEATGYVPGVERAGTPPLKLVDGPMGIRTNTKPATAFPASIALAASFDPDLARTFGAALAREARAYDQDVILAPGVNPIRVPHRAELRVLLRGSRRRRRDRREHGRGYPVRRGRRDHETPRRQQPGTGPVRGERGGGRTHATGALPPSVPPAG